MTLSNQTPAATSYRIKLVNQRMTEGGGIEQIKSPAPTDMAADTMIRYAPHQIVLQPGVSQTVRLSVRAPEGLADGEYRSHMVFEAVPPADLGQNVEAGAKDKSQISIRLIPVYSISIPVIVRHGNLTFTSAIENLSLASAATGPELHFNLTRAGNRSSYGDLVAMFSRGGAKPVEVAHVSGIAVYTPNALRKVSLRLNPPKGVTVSGGTLSLSYRAPQADGGQIIAVKDIAVP